MKFKAFTIVSIGLLVFFACSSLVVTVSATTDYRTRSQIIANFLAFDSHPNVDIDVIGKSVQGLDIYLLKIGNSSGGTVLIDAAIHGNEHASTETLFYIVQWVLTSEDAEAQRILQRNYLLIIPIVNMDGYGTSRYNAHGVDLNRNYETGWGKFNDARRGSYPLSEPETQAVHSVFIAYSVTWYLNLHTGDYRISPPWAYQSGVPEESVHREVYDNYYALSQQRGVSAIPYEISGNYAGGTARDEGYTHGAYTYCVELYSYLKPSYSKITDTMVPKLIALTISVCQKCEIPSSEPEPPEPEPEEMTVEDWKTFWEWLKQHPPSKYRLSNWKRLLEYRLNQWGTPLTVEDWENFWSWLKQHPPRYWNTSSWMNFLDYSLQEWKSCS